MGNIYNPTLFNKSILLLVLSAFSTATIAPLSASYEVRAGIGLGDIAFIARMEKLYEKAKKYKERLDFEKMIEVMLDIKLEVEGYTGKKISLGSKLDEIEKESARRGAKYEKGELKQIKKMIEKREKKKEHRLFFMNDCYMNDLQYDASCYEILADMDFQAKHKDKDDEKQEKEVYIPVTVTIGITAALCGYFLKIIPHPACQAASVFLVTQGMELCVAGTIARLEENRRVDRENEKKEGKK